MSSSSESSIWQAGVSSHLHFRQQWKGRVGGQICAPAHKKPPGMFSNQYSKYRCLNWEKKKKKRSQTPKLFQQLGEFLVKCVRESAWPQMGRGSMHCMYSSNCAVFHRAPADIQNSSRLTCWRGNCHCKGKRGQVDGEMTWRSDTTSLTHFSIAATLHSTQQRQRGACGSSQLQLHFLKLALESRLSLLGLMSARGNYWDKKGFSLLLNKTK